MPHHIKTDKKHRYVTTSRKESSMGLADILQASRPSLDEISVETAEIREELLADSDYLTKANFDSFSPADLERMFDEYDERFFDSQCRAMLGKRPLTFRISKRMTSTGGTTTHYQPLSRRHGKERFEIAVSSTLLFQAFHDVTRPITVTGLLCRSRLEALQRIMEHEITHLIEMVVWGDSNCSAKRFQNITSGFFGHTDHTHNLITPGERAKVKFGIQPGTRVRFRFEGAHREGVVNRITKRATVLVPSGDGELFSDGQRYKRYYVPVSMLEPVS